MDIEIRRYWQGMADETPPADAPRPASRHVVAFDDANVTFVLPVSGRWETVSLAEFAAWGGWPS